MVLTITLISTALIGISIRVFIWKRKKAHLISIKNDLNLFRIASDSGSVEEIIKFGNRLIWNGHLTPTILKQISDEIDKQDANHPKLEELKNNIYNRQLRFDRLTPDTWGSSGL